MALEEYRRKRDFEKTPEPAGGDRERDAQTANAGQRSASKETDAPRAPEADSRLLYLIQKHDASRLHYDFRLELDGVLLSWAIPKGPSLDPRDRHLAARTEDHPLEYGGFEGIIPEGEYGGGTVLLWDRGTWEPEGDPREMLRKGDLKFALHGGKLRGSWVLVRMKPRPERGDKEEWLLIKHRDDQAVDGDGQRVLRERPESVASGRSLEEIAAAGQASVWHGDLPAGGQTGVRPGEDFVIDPGAIRGAEPAAQPRFVQPELATLVKKAPSGDDWLHEIKFDGYRTICRIEKGSVTMYSRNGKDWTDRYGTLAAELARLPVESAVLDGEVVVLLPDGRSSFQELQSALGDETVAGRGEGDSRLLYYVFDLLYLDGFDLTGAAIEDRRDLLRRLLARVGPGGRLLFSEHIPGSGAEVLRQACRMGLEGIVSKRTSSPYRPGARGSEWLKTKCKDRQEFVIGGYTDPTGARTGFGALLVGVREEGGLRYVGRVGTGFDERSLAALAARLREMRVDDPPFTADLAKAQKNSHWVRPELVAEVEFTEWTRDGGIRHPSFKRLLKNDASPPECDGRVREKDAESANSSAICATEDTVSRRSVRSGGRGFVLQQPGKGLREDKLAEDVIAEVPMKAADENGGAGVAVGDVTITHPERVFWPTPGVTKSDLIRYYGLVAERMLPYVLDRPIAMVRCPSGVADGRAATSQRGGPPGCFFHKHPSEDFPGPVGRVTITESGGPAPYLTITGPGSLTALAQMGVLEIHIWGSTWPDIERPDMMVFDLDPGPGVEWRALADGARLVREVLHAARLESFVKTTGGKGLHVVVPLTPNEGWKEVGQFCRRVAEVMTELSPDRFTANMSKAKRQGKIYVDYVRNNRGSTSIAPFSTRAKERATVAVPLGWSELGGRIRADSFTVDTLANRLRRLKEDPWEGYFATRDAQKLEPATREALGLS
jgi:bifunctional non-homologous end joining protein LigD